MNNKNCFIIHGCPSNVEQGMNPATRIYDKHWLPWLKKELIAKGVPTEMPLMPEPWAPDYQKFKQEFKKYEVNEHSILIGHSCGSTFLVRWLGETKQKIAKLILVAPWKIAHTGDSFRPNFYTYDIDVTIKERVSKIIMFTANDEADEGQQSLKIFNKALGGEIISLPNHGHYCFKNMKTEEFPELLQEVLS
ncbi:alpha/beta hydrolase [Patescibacteria group bacterium]|nr:alpha/beta hydrolase [Patescibacteria group bacterium]